MVEGGRPNVLGLRLRLPGPVVESFWLALAASAAWQSLDSAGEAFVSEMAVLLFAVDAFLLLLLVVLPSVLAVTLGDGTRLAFISGREDDEDERCV